MNRKEELAILIEHANNKVISIYSKIEDTIKIFEHTVRQHISNISSYPIDDIVCRISENSVEIGYEPIKSFKMACILYPPSYHREQWELNFGSVGSFTSGNGYCDRTILLGIVAKEFKLNLDLMRILRDCQTSIKILKKQIDEVGLDTLKNESRDIDIAENEAKNQKIIEEIILANGVDMGEGFYNIYIRQSTRYKSPIRKIEFTSITDKKIEAIYYYNDGFSKQRYRGDRDYVLRNCLTMAKVSKAAKERV